MPLEKDKSEEFIISKSLERIVNLKKRIDRLIFLYISVTVFGIANFKCFKEISVLGGLNINNNWMYHLGIAATLIVIYGLIGSHLIEYVIKRKSLDDLLINNDFFKADNQFDVSKTIIPSSIYEYMYSWDIYDDIRKDALRKISVGILYMSFFIGHALIFSHLFLINIPIIFKVILAIGILIGLVQLSREFLNSVGRARKELKNRLTLPTYIAGSIVLLTYIAMLIWCIDFGPCQKEDKVTQKEPCSSSSTYIQ